MEKDYLLARTYQEREALKINLLEETNETLPSTTIDQYLNEVLVYRNSAIRQKAALLNSFNFRQPDLIDFASIDNLEQSRRLNLIIPIGVVAANMMGITTKTDNPVIFKANIYDGYYDFFDQYVKNKDTKATNKIYLAAEENVSNLFIYWNNLLRQTTELLKN